MDRRHFLQKTVWLIGIPPAFAMWRLAVRHRDLNEATPRLEIPANLAGGVYFRNEFILVREGKILRAFSARCTHAGCLIDREANQEFVCPCHGSRFDLHGRPIQGPATRTLASARIEKSKDAATFRLTLP